MDIRIRQNQKRNLAEPQGDLLLLDLLHRINERVKIVERPTEPEKDSEDD